MKRIFVLALAVGLMGCAPTTPQAQNESTVTADQNKSRLTSLNAEMGRESNSDATQRTYAGLIIRDYPGTPEAAAAEKVLMSPAKPVRSNAYCESVSRMAASVMMARQRGMDMAKVMKADSDASDEFVQSMQAMVIAAYESPRFSTDIHQQRAVEDFRNDAFLACVKP
jgi:hypothetical protein